MSQIKLNQAAPNFELQNFKGKTIRLSDYKNNKNVILVFNRGFT
jgi:peroxiredoxin